MTDILVVQGAGMNMRGKSQIEIFGTTTLAQINQQIEDYALELNVNVEIFHSNIEGEVANAFYAAAENNIDGALFNPAGYTNSSGILPMVLSQLSYPVYEVHVSNPSSRGIQSKIQPACQGSVYGCGLYSYYLGMLAIKNSLAQ